MPVQYDWGLDSDGDLDISNNDFTYVLSDQQHVEDTIKAAPLWWKQYPADGVGIDFYRKGSGKVQQVMGVIKKQLQQDGYNCNNPVVILYPSGVFDITPNAKRL